MGALRRVLSFWPATLFIGARRLEKFFGKKILPATQHSYGLLFIRCSIADQRITTLPGVEIFFPKPEGQAPLAVRRIS